jgi:hypothetical protein
MAAIASRLLGSLVLVASLFLASGQDQPPLLCTGSCNGGFTCPNADGTTRASFNLAGLHTMYPLFSSYDTAKPRWEYAVSLCGSVPIPHDDSGELMTRCESTAGNVAAFQWEKGGFGDGYCYVAGRFGVKSDDDTAMSTIELLEDYHYPALGPLGLRFNFTSGEMTDGCENNQRRMTVNLRCPYWLNGYAPNALTPVLQKNTSSNPFPNPPLALHPSSATRIPSVGQTTVQSECSYVIDMDSIYACPLACLPKDGIDLTSSTPIVIDSCANHGICRDIVDEPAQMGCLCNRDLSGDRCDERQSAGHASVLYCSRSSRLRAHFRFHR